MVASKQQGFHYIQVCNNASEYYMQLVMFPVQDKHFDSHTVVKYSPNLRLALLVISLSCDEEWQWQSYQA